MREESEQWLFFARQDLRVAELTLDEGIYNQTCFHSHQCVEKTLKAALYNNGMLPPRTHTITDLIRLLPDELRSKMSSSLAQLDDFYIPTRYPDAAPGSLAEGLPGYPEANEALTQAQETLNKVEQFLIEQNGESHG
jgi:HEPN domain-containing protein